MESRAVKLKLVLDDVNHAYPGILTYILDDQGRIRKHVQIFIKNEALFRRDTLDINVDQADEIYIMQALSGG
jgi:hypothetical protein